MEIRAIAPNEWNYTYSQSMQITGQTGNIGHLRGDFDSGGYGFYTTWSDHRPQWKTDEFKTELDEVINTLRSKEYGLLQNRPAMSEYARRFPDSAFKGNYCTEYGFRVDTESMPICSAVIPQRAIIIFTAIAMSRNGSTSISAMQKKVSVFIDSHYKELFRIPDGGKIRVTSAWGEKSEHTCRYIDEYHTEVGNNLYHICEFAECMEKNGATYEPIPAEPQAVKAPKHKNLER